MPFLEIEKKYELLEEDIKIIQSNFDFVSEKFVEDVYYDTEDFFLCKNNIWLRERNWKLQLKYPCWKDLTDTSCYEEYYDEDAKNKLKEIIWDKSLIKLAEIKTHRKKFKIKWQWYNFTIDVDDFWFGRLVEIEIKWEGSLEDLKNKIKEFKKFWNLKGPEASEWKWLLMLKNQRPELYQYWKQI